MARGRGRRERDEGPAVARLAERRRWRYVEVDADASAVLPFDLLRDVHVRWREHVLWGNSRFGGHFEAFDARCTPLDGDASLTEVRRTCVVTTLPEAAERFVVRPGDDIDLREHSTDAALRRHLVSHRPEGVALEVTGTHLLAVADGIPAAEREVLIDVVLDLRATLPRPAAAAPG